MKNYFYLDNCIFFLNGIFAELEKYKVNTFTYSKIMHDSQPLINIDEKKNRKQKIK